ncbi:MAG TPA: M23 family metallopeptidase [Vicinamibacterales bacterium]|nr:M23 family metallopeptidase [Vicinamibacterales bacterium]
MDQSKVQWIGVYGQQNQANGQSFFHNGIDLGASYGTEYYAAANGRVSTIEYNSGQGLPGTNYRIDLTVGNLTLDYHFEVDGSVSDSDRHGAILVSTGQTVTAGQHIGTLLAQGSGAHVHFGTLLDGTAHCPLDFYPADVAAQFEALFNSGIEKRPANANLCQQ